LEETVDYGKTAFAALGGVTGIRALANCFYDIIEAAPEARIIRDMHPSDLGATRENLALFLCGWLGGPPLYKEKHGSVNLTGIHSLLRINVTEKDIWLSCMQQALDKQPIDKGLKKYLAERFQQPAEKICLYCLRQSPWIPELAVSSQKKS
jgi:hemoglobin